MKNPPANSSESLWRRNVSGAARAGLPAELELEARLTDALAKTPDVPVPSNFTARLLDTIEREEKQSARSHGWHWSWRSLFPRVAVAAAVLIFAGVSIQHYEANSQRFALAKGVATVAVAQPVPNMDALNNFDAIQRMTRSVHADGQLLADLQ